MFLCEGSDLLRQNVIRILFQKTAVSVVQFASVVYFASIVFAIVVLPTNMSCYNFPKSVIEECAAFKNNCCLVPNCGFIHKYKYCYKYQNTTCSDNKCPFLHCTSVEQLRYETTGKETEQLKREVGRTLQNSSICGKFKNGDCTLPKCRLRHVKYDVAPLECTICTEIINVEHLGAGDCGHIFCANCAMRCLINDEYENFVETRCPICRKSVPYKKLS
ncbi:uncharacterized protein LOC112468927 [Temnothorax curvispinosus]|uniref:Uncharacterized protein LOC112468927 n=1 Tax=Temnothorax curvispinosus TaxID=300111 RepID=A0A6J1RIF7_9HYME|nr:uncharacterized protein LOC112468927 [Temnothorax curvispinosus]